jgi:hypothetical protein
MPSASGSSGGSPPRPRRSDRVRCVLQLAGEGRDQLWYAGGGRHRTQSTGLEIRATTTRSPPSRTRPRHSRGWPATMPASTVLRGSRNRRGIVRGAPGWKPGATTARSPPSRTRPRPSRGWAGHHAGKHRPSRIAQPERHSPRRRTSCRSSGGFSTRRPLRTRANPIDRRSPTRAPRLPRCPPFASLPSSSPRRRTSCCCSPGFQPGDSNPVFPTRCFQPGVSNPVFPTRCFQPGVSNPVFPTRCFQPAAPTDAREPHRSHSYSWRHGPA